MIDSTIIRAHQYSAGALKTAIQEQGLEMSKRWFSSKLHAVYEAYGNQVSFFVTVGQRSDYTKALDLVEGREMVG